MAFNITEFLRSFRRTFTPFDEQTGEFTPIDTEHSEVSLKTIERAQENGKKNLPKPTQKKRDSIALDIDSYLADCISIAKSKLINRFNAISELTSSQSNRRPQTEMKSEYESASSALKSFVLSGYDSLFNKKRKFVDIEKEYNVFRKNNKLIGPAKYPKNLVGYVGILVLLFFIELYINAFTLRDSHPNDISGIVYETFLFCLINLFFGAGLGLYALRKKNHVDAFTKVTGYLLCILIFALLCSSNLFFGHYRDALSVLTAEVSQGQDFDQVKYAELGKYAIDSLTTNPFYLKGFKSVLLVMVGLLFGLLAAIDFYLMDDPYPGYGRLQRFQERFSREYRNLRDDISTKSNAIVEELRNNLLGTGDLEQAGSTAIKNRQRNMETIEEKFKNWVANIETTGCSMYARYQEENLKFRKDKKTPLCFKESYKLPKDATIINYPTIASKPVKKSNNALAQELSTKMQNELKKYDNLFNDLQKMSADELRFDVLDQKKSAIDKIAPKSKKK